MIHLALHALVPVLVALVFYRKDWRMVAVILLGTMVVDVDHLLATPIYDPARCSIGFHPLHTAPAIIVYAALFVVPIAVRRFTGEQSKRRSLRIIHLVGLGLLIHMVLDWIDCLV